MNWYLTALKKYAVFSGRARRREYWMFALFNVIVAIVLNYVDNSSMLASIYWLAVLLPSLAVGVRRMHDTGHSGWWLIVPIVNLIFSLMDSEPGDNKYGPNPKETGAA